MNLPIPHRIPRPVDPEARAFYWALFGAALTIVAAALLAWLLTITSGPIS